MVGRHGRHKGYGLMEFRRSRRLTAKAMVEAPSNSRLRLRTPESGPPADPSSAVLAGVVAVAAGRAVGLPDGVGLALPDGLAVGLALALKLGDAVGLAPKLGLAVGRAVGDGLAVGLGRMLGKMLGRMLGSGVEGGPRVGVGSGVGASVGSGVGVGASVGSGVGVGVGIGGSEKVGSAKLGKKDGSRAKTDTMPAPLSRPTASERLAIPVTRRLAVRRLRGRVGLVIGDFSCQGMRTWHGLLRSDNGSGDLGRQVWPMDFS